MTSLSVIGVPSSAGSYAAGQDQAPRALRDAGMLTALTEVGIDVHALGDLPQQIWTPDPAQPRAQNAAQVIESVVHLADTATTTLGDGRRLLVLGGNCTIATGAVSALRRHTSGPSGLVYVDRHFDMNTPESTDEGALDWMGLAHALNLPGALPAYVDALGHAPLLDARHLSFLGVDPTQSTEFEREHLARLGIAVTTQLELVDDPFTAADAALRALPDEVFAVHVDVDVLDFTDAPLSENTSGRNVGPTLDQLADSLAVLIADPRWRVLTIGEINPTRSAGVPELLPRFARTIADVLSAHSAL
ncbi:hypothetical protein A2J03_02455 [Rhodococcus sp. EPR-157]|uniref:arginase family protein n=1 Tax=Rhodococcus sp. EPR-157 TaxID=1813677 RepID=UPI0007BBF933|nr:arginase family protein [Rhodococcus sp. EPR-157]KZF09401.1 hypothetical protein A2J03_02455 [Rhodococcus sp. EPR-157]